MTAVDPAARRVAHVAQSHLELGNGVTHVAGGSIVHNPRVPEVYDANHVARITATTAGDVDLLLREVEARSGHLSHRQFHCDPDTPPAFEARLLLDGYEPSLFLLMQLDGPLRATPPAVAIAPVDDARTWATFEALHASAWAELMARLGLPPHVEVGRDMAATKRAKAPPTRYWLVHDGRVPAGYCSSWGGIDGVGQVEDLFVLPAHRRRGLATALAGRCVAEARAAGAGPVMLVADAADTLRHMYAAMGFVPAAVKRVYRRILA